MYDTWQNTLRSSGHGSLDGDVVVDHCEVESTDAVDALHIFVVP
jgi:hypothetical protein